jgi:hypothetical protein
MLAPAMSLRCAAFALLMTAVPAYPQASATLSPFQHAWLETHNEARSAVGMEPLAWSDRLAVDAAAWARYLAANDLYDHATPDQRRGQGENLWKGPRDQWPAREVIGFFLAEQRDFHFGTFPDISHTGQWRDVGHYAQVIWPETREVGCAIAYTASDEVLVCRYWPAGNVWGRAITPPPRITRR